MRQTRPIFGTSTPDNLPPLPLRPSDNPTQEELAACLGDLLVWALNRRLGELLAGGVTGDQVSQLRMAAIRFQKGQTQMRDLSSMRKMLPLLERVRIE